MLFGLTPSTIGTEVARACWHCTHYPGQVAGRAHLRRVQGGRLSVQTSPTSGCAFWQRVPVADEVPGAPAGYRDAVVGAGGVRTGLLRSLPRPAHSFI
jgi:hypothetical protein